MRQTRIVATLGPAVDSRERLAAIVAAGVNTVRLNMSHGGKEEKERWIGWIREIEKERGEPVAILADLCGPKIRAGRFAGGSAKLDAGASFALTTRDIVGDASAVSTTYPSLPSDVHTGNRILLDDGAIELEVVSVTAEDVVTRVVVGGVLKDSKGINLPGVRVSAPSLTAKDRDDLAWALGRGVDYVAVSFVRTADDVLEARRLIEASSPGTPLVAKIEKPEAVENLDAILDACDGVMVARGDMGVEIGPEKVPLIQKRIIRAADSRGRIVITATQMLESMTGSPRPTRAEASDVANAILDGSDAVMLSGETAVGRYPVETVRMMARIIDEIEANRPAPEPGPPMRVVSGHPFADILGQAAAATADSIGAAALAVFTMSGLSALVTAKCSARTPIIGFTPDARTWRRMALYPAVRPFLAPSFWSTEEILDKTDKVLLDSGWVKKGDLIVIVYGTTTNVSGSTNSLRLMRIGE